MSITTNAYGFSELDVNVTRKMHGHKEEISVLPKEDIWCGR